MSETPRHVLLATIGSLGDLHPMLVLARELMRRGHRSTIATTAAYRSRVEAHGIGFHALRPEGSPDDEAIMGRVMDPKNGPRFVIRDLLMPHLEDTYRDLYQVARGADFMLAGEIVFAAPVLAEQLGLPWGAVILSPSSFLSVHDPSVLAPLPATKHLRQAPRILHRLLLDFGKRMTRAWVRPVHELRRTLGLRASRDPLFADKFSPQLNLALFSAVFARPQPDWPAPTVQPGFVFYEEADSWRNPQWEPFLQEGAAPIVFTLGSAAVASAGDFFGQSVEVARRLGRRALLLAGKHANGLALPANVAAFAYAPYSQIFPRAAAVVHQGGIGTTAQALRAGIPQLVVPFGFDQPDNAARLVRLGVARSIPRSRYRADTAARLLEEVLASPRYAERARELSRRIEAEQGVQGACDAIERQLAGRRDEPSGERIDVPP